MSTDLTEYNRVSKVLHWFSALTIFSLFALGHWMVDLSYHSEWYKVAPYVHKSIGLLLAFFTVVRIVWKLMTPAPKVEGAIWEVVLAKLLHISLYLLLFAIFASGYMLSTADGRSIDLFNWFSLPGLGSLVENHEDIAGAAQNFFAALLIILAIGHALAALKHHFISKDNTLKKML